MAQDLYVLAENPIAALERMTRWLDGVLPIYTMSRGASLGAVLKRMGELARSVEGLHEWVSRVLFEVAVSKFPTEMERMAGGTTEGAMVVN